MTSYRAYMLNEHGKFFRGEDVEAANDAAAIAAGQGLLGNPAHGFEIWRGRDLIFSSRTASA